MAQHLSASKLVLLAVHFASHAYIGQLSSLIAQFASVLREDLILRILLTHLPETLQSAAYVSLLQQIAKQHDGTFQNSKKAKVDIDTSSVNDLSEEQATQKVRRLRLLKLNSSDVSVEGSHDLITLFLFQRSFKVDHEAGMITQLPGLLLPFLGDPALRTWMASTVLPLWRRNSQYYLQSPDGHTLLEFHNLPDRSAISCLLSQTGVREDDYSFVGRDLRGLIRPWLQNQKRWHQGSHTVGEDGAGDPLCPGWDQFLEWLVLQPTGAWKVSVNAIEQWGGPGDVDFGEVMNLPPLKPDQQDYLERTYIRAAFAVAYLINNPSIESLSSAYRVSEKIALLLGDEAGEDGLSLDVVAGNLPDLAHTTTVAIYGPKLASYLRNDLLTETNPLTRPEKGALSLLRALNLSAYISSRCGVPCTIRRAGDLAFIQDEKEQNAEFTKLMRAVSHQAPRNNEEYWTRARREVLWLRDWGNGTRISSGGTARGTLGLITREHIETELLKALLLNSRYDLAKKLYEDDTGTILSAKVIQDAVQEAALSAFDNSSNPNRTRGGLKKCDEIIHAFPKTVDKFLPSRKRIESLITATHALSDYRLVLKQGEPFSPVVLRVHSDPISIIEKVLEQNAGAYTRLSEFMEMGIHMVQAGLPIRGSSPSSAISGDQDNKIFVVEKRITAMCVEAALKEDDFETAYSYVVNRLTPASPGGRADSSSGPVDVWSCNAALQAGKYIRTERSLQPTHLGTSSGNLEVRHFEQRIECLATALRVAPGSQLQEILKSFRRCEEQLESAIKEEAAKEAAWDAVGDMSDLPGTFDSPDPDKVYFPRNQTASAAARQAEEAPMSLFDLSRATARVAQRNFTTLSSLQGVTRGIQQSLSPDLVSGDQMPQRVRKRDQFREAATGTLVSGVGWLLGANVNRDAETS